MNQTTIDKFLEIYGRLLVYDLQRRVGVSSIFDLITDADTSFLVHIASCLALGPPTPDSILEAQWKAWAYDVVTRIAETRAKTDPRYRQAAELILARLGNFPGRQHMHDLYAKDLLHERSPPALALESLARETENTIDFKGIGKRTLTDFQVRLIESLRRGRPVSISAPTSAGKSYALSLDISDAIARGVAKSIIYIVPTRALIRQVMQDLLDRLREADIHEVAVSAAPTPIEREQLSKGIVYVLTQERLTSLLYALDDEFSVDRIYIDEAQAIGDDDRGLILHSAIRQALNKFPSAQVCFASPLIENPDFLLSEFELGTKEDSFIEHQSPVSQTVVILREVDGNHRLIDVDVLTPTGPKDVAHIPVTFDFRGLRKRLAHTAKLFTAHDESSVIYADGAGDAMAIAAHIAELIDNETTDEEVLDLVSFVRDHIHSKYGLVDTLKKGVAFHYGKMPHLIRAQIEELLRRRKIRFVVATSTLLQGINLPAKNIFIYRPHKGPGKPMHGPDFWNLAGRAGRLRENFNGTIWCIHPSQWEVNPIEGPRLSVIKSSFRESLKSEELGNALLSVANDSIPIGKVNDRQRVENVLGKVFSEFTCDDIGVAQSKYAEEADRQRLAELDSKFREILQSLDVPKDVCKRNSTVSPLSLNKLWNLFRHSDRIETLIPHDPVKAGALDRMRTIFRIVDEIFVQPEGDRWKYFAPLAYWWIRGRSLKELIADHLSYNNVPSDRQSTNESIRRFLEGLEQTVRFEYVKYLRAYIDTLTAFLNSTEQTDLVSLIAPLHLYIEFGARDRVLVMLMSLGLSRMTSIFVREFITEKDDIGRKECWAKLRRLRLKGLDIPNVCKAEIQRLRGSS